MVTKAIAIWIRWQCLHSIWNQCVNLDMLIKLHGTFNRRVHSTYVWRYFIKCRVALHKLYHVRQINFDPHTHNVLINKRGRVERIHTDALRIKSRWRKHNFIRISALCWALIHNIRVVDFDFCTHSHVCFKHNSGLKLNQVAIAISGMWFFFINSIYFKEFHILTIRLDFGFLGFASLLASRDWFASISWTHMNKLIEFSIKCDFNLFALQSIAFFFRN